MRGNSTTKFRQLPAVSRRYGLPAIGFELTTDLALAPAGPLVHGTEHRADGRAIGELELEVFAASLIIDRDGILAAKASALTGTPSHRVNLPGARGYRAMAVGKAQLAYLYVYAIAAPQTLDAGLLITVRSAQPDWPAAEAILHSLRILTRNGIVANDDPLDDAPMPLSLVE